MCIAIYLAVIGLFLFYSDYVVGQYSLAVNAPQESPMVVAIGWEMVGHLWPIIVLGMLLASAVSVVITRRCRSCAT